MRVTTLALIILMSICNLAAFDQEDRVSVSARVSENEITEEDVVQLEVRVLAGESMENIDVKFPQLRDFDKLGEQTSRSFQQFNNDISVSLSYIYTLFPRRKGTLTIPAIEVVVAGKKYLTQALTVKVSAGQGTSDILVRLRADRNSVYIGQQLLVTTELLFRVRITNYELLEDPDLEGFVALEDQLSNPIVDEIEYQGILYRRAIIQRQILFPVSSGEKEINPRKFRIQYYSSGYGFGTKIAVRSTNILNLDVKSFPLNQPEKFTGAVGDYSISWSADRLEGKANEPFTFTIQLQGLGDIERAPDPRPEFPPEFEIINVTTDSDAQFARESWAGTKIWKYIVIPNSSGEETIDPLEYCFFNPIEGQFTTISTDPVTLNIAEADKATQVVITAPLELDTGEEDIRYIKTGVSRLANQETTFLGSFFFWVLIIIPPVTNALIIIGGKILGLSQKDKSVSRRRRAIQTLQAELKKIRPGFDESQLTRIRQAISQYFADKFERKVESMTISEIQTALVRFDLHESREMETLERILNICDAGRYAPTRTESASAEKLSFLASQAIVELDKKL